MNTAKVNSSISKVIAAYQDKLSVYSDEVFQIIPPINGWSYSEVYSHIFDSSLLSVMALQHCVDNKGEDKPTAFAVKVILFLGFLPPAKKYKVPKKLMDRVKKISKAEALDLIHQFEKDLQAVYGSVANAKEQSKIKHPRLGYLNAKQWFRFIEIHLKHHLKQLNRIEKSFQR
ncbi:DinB family protein [Pedobacter punctiformis]|uniref:DinB family protein n=1 Tax=Pedobacter punctiformis TaxID=3004097 RepID=A0ABT4L4W5_9SPHI|nr:DinB family protein [Pedobacter sp. HCMS5-2]MCZ4242956.1 DinB family protein [Pedobacter sp. HCMS5-2]